MAFVNYAPTTEAASLSDQPWPRRILARLARGWASLRRLYGVLKLVRFSLILALVAVLVLLFNDQAQDVLRAFGEDPDLRILWFVLAATGCAAIAWYTARVMFYFRFDDPASDPACFPRVKIWLPRLLGGAVLALAGGAVFKASAAYGGWLAGPGAVLRWLALGMLGLAGLFVLLVTMRRMIFWRVVALRPRGLTSLRQLPWTAWLPLAVVGLVGFVLMVWFAHRAVLIAPAFGTATIALVAAAVVMPSAALLVYAGNRLNLPVISLLLLWAGLVTYLVDNHYIRLSPAAPSYPDPIETEAARSAIAAKLARPETAAEYVERWLASLPPAAGRGPVPVFVVAAEGGGIRAAYWTAMVLGELQDRAREQGWDFGRHVLAISGVSGGSLGAATFAALAANEHGGRPAKASAACADLQALPTSTRLRAERVLAKDFLSAPVAIMLFSDALQQLVPLAFTDDRGVALEQSWEHAWANCEAGDWFSQRFEQLWAGPERFHVPLLFLNSTVVETGQRLISAPVPLDRTLFSQALDGRDVIGERMALSTAVHNSARFTYVSPAGTVQRQDAADSWLRLVDGGYFENSGATTADEVLDLLASAGHADAPRILPVVIHISNDPAITDRPDLADNQRRWLNQLRAPLDALWHSRPAHGDQARAALQRKVSQHILFRLCEEDARQPLPLGWSLSSAAREEMRRQLLGERNAARIGQVMRLLQGAGGAEASLRSVPTDCLPGSHSAGS